MSASFFEQKIFFGVFYKRKVFIMRIVNSNPVFTQNFQGKSSDKTEKPEHKNKMNNAIMGTLIALASMTPINSSADYSTVKGENFQTETVLSDDEYNNLSVKFSDDNGILEASDFKYSSNEAKRKAQGYLDGLKPYMGKNCTQAVSDLANNLVNVFNMSNTYAFDLNTDEMVKNAESSILYDRAGRVLATKLKYSEDVEEVVTYKYYPNGSIDAATYQGDKVIDYRKDGTRFSLNGINDSGPTEVVKYDYKGREKYRSVTSPNSFQEMTYDEKGRVIKHFYKDDISGFQKIYNNGELVLSTFYDKKGRVNRYIDDYFEKQGEDIVVSGYLSNRVIHKSEPYNTLYKEAPLDGKIIKPVRQGTTGTCYIAGVVNSLVRIPAGRQLLDDALPSDFDTSKCVVDFKGFNKQYVIPSDVISHNMSRLGRKDADYSGMVRAYERFRESDDFHNKTIKLPDFFYKDLRGEDDRRVDSGTPSEFFYALTGKIMNNSGDKITDSDIQKARECLATGKGIVNFGTVKEENKKNEIPLSDRENGVVPGHILSVIRMDAKEAVLYDSVTEKEFSYPLSKMKKYGSTLYWATVD